MAGTKPQQTQPTDEIDLGQLFRLIGAGFHSVFRGLLRVFLFLKKNAIILGILIVAGLAAGYALNSLLVEKQSIELIVKPNLESKEYLYNVVTELESNIKSENYEFFRELGVELHNLKEYDIEIEPLGEKTKILEDDMKYLELLKEFESSGLISDVLRAEILNRSSLSHRILITFKNPEKGTELAQAIVTYINSNPFFAELIKVTWENGMQRIERNEALIVQIDTIVHKYTQKLQAAPTAASGQLLLEETDQLDVTGLLDLKTSLIRDTERTRLNLVQQKDPVSIVNFGKQREELKSLFGKRIVLLPSIFVSLFLLFRLFQYLTRKAKELGME